MKYNYAKNVLLEFLRKRVDGPLEFVGNRKEITVWDIKMTIL